MGIELLDAWYQRGSSSCCPPNSKICFDVIVIPELIIRTKIKNDIILTRNFMETERPYSVSCGYYVLHYTPHNSYSPSSNNN